MSYLAQRAVVDTRTRVLLWTGGLSSLVTTTALLALAALLGLRWWGSGAVVPLSWGLPPAAALFLLPGVPVLGLVALRSVVAGRARTVGGQHLMTWAGRWAWVWVASTAAGLLHTVRGLYGVPLSELVAVDNLVEVAAASGAVRSGLSVLFVALLVALFADRLGGWREAVGVAAVTGTALVAGLPTDATLAHTHATAGHPGLLVAAAVQAVALAAWLGALAAVGHLRTPPYQVLHHLERFGRLVTAAVLLVGVATLAAEVLRPGPGAPGVLLVGQLAGLALVTAVGHRHRRRTAPVLAGGRLLLLALVAAEVVVLAAVLAVVVLLPVAG